MKPAGPGHAPALVALAALASGLVIVFGPPLESGCGGPIGPQGDRKPTETEATHCPAERLTNTAAMT